MIVQGLFQGDRARYPFKFRTGVLITTSIVVAVLRKMKTQSTFYRCRGIKEDENAVNQHDSVFP